MLRALADAARLYGVPVVGGHTNLRSEAGHLAAAVLGRATRLLASFDAGPGDMLAVKPADRVARVARSAARGIAAAALGSVDGSGRPRRAGGGGGDRLGFRGEPPDRLRPAREGRPVRDRPLRIAVLAHSTDPRSRSRATPTTSSARVTGHLTHFGPDEVARFDVFHAQDGIRGNPLATLALRRLAAVFQVATADSRRACALHHAEADASLARPEVPHA